MIDSYFKSIEGYLYSFKSSGCVKNSTKAWFKKTKFTVLTNMIRIGSNFTLKIICQVFQILAGLD